MKFLKKLAFCYIAPLLTICSVATSQLEAQCDPSPCAIDWCSLLVPALVGAAAGAATGAAVNSRGKHGKKGPEGDRGHRGEQGNQGERGPEGDNPFRHDYNNSLTFSFTIDSVTPAGTGMILPYITQPTGDVLTTSSIALTGTGTNSVTLSSPYFGDYVFGFELPGQTSTITIDYTVTITPTGRNPTTYTGSVTVESQGNRYQLPFNYTYGPTGTVPA